MYENFGGIINEVCSFWNQDRATIDAAVLASIKRRINQVQDFIFYLENWEWRKKTFYLTLRTPYTTGTLTAIQFNTLISGSGTTWTKDMEFGYLVIDNLAYKIKTVASATSLTLEAPFPKANTGAGKTYSIIFPDYVKHERISSVIDVRVSGKAIKPANKSQIINLLPATGEPNIFAFGDRLLYDFYNTGTVAVTNASPVVTLSSGTFPLNIEGHSFIVKEFTKIYTIKSRDSDTQITLEENYDSTTSSGKSYAVNPQGTSLVRFSYSPDDYYSAEIDSLISPNKLVNDTDFSLVPIHTPLLLGAIWLAGIDFKNENPVRIQQAKADFEKSIAMLRKQYKVIANLAWTTNDELIAKHQGLGIDNPLRSY
ncbi:MAG: hypothetical protein ACHQ1D_00800 [Nitrososphaerales archaeon]